MAQMGAEVIKIEHPQKPDFVRGLGPIVAPDISAAFQALNMGKRSLAMDVNTAAGREVFFDLVKRADLVVEGFRPGMLRKLGINYETARAVNPRIIYVSITGFGQDGPYANLAGHDLNYIGFGGLLGLTGTAEGPPIAPGAQIADVAGGAYMAVIGSLSALLARDRTGTGQHVDVAMLDGILPLMTLQLAEFWQGSPFKHRGQMPLSGALACYQVYPCADAEYVALGALEPKFWQGFCELVDKPEWVARHMEPQQADLIAQVGALFKTRTRDQWVAMAGDRDVCLTPISNLDEIANNPQLRHRGSVIPGDDQQPTRLGFPIKYSETPTKNPNEPAPRPGDHGREILRELGYSEKDINRLKGDAGFHEP